MEKRTFFIVAETVIFWSVQWRTRRYKTKITITVGKEVFMTAIFTDKQALLESATFGTSKNLLKGEHKDFCMLILKDLLDVKKHIVVKKNS